MPSDPKQKFSTHCLQWSFASHEVPAAQPVAAWQSSSLPRHEFASHVAHSPLGGVLASHALQSGWGTHVRSDGAVPAGHTMLPLPSVASHVAQ